MEEVLGILGFSLGASIAVSAVRSLGEGAQPLVRNVLKTGIRVWDAAAGATAAARQEVGAAADDGRTSAAPRTRRTRAQPQKIQIARS
jgi:hypothetical protein